MDPLLMRYFDKLIGMLLEEVEIEYNSQPSFYYQDIKIPIALIIRKGGYTIRTPIDSCALGWPKSEHTFKKKYDDDIDIIYMIYR